MDNPKTYRRFFITRNYKQELVAYDSRAELKLNFRVKRWEVMKILLDKR